MSMLNKWTINIIGTIILSSSCSTRQANVINIKNDWDDLKLNGRVKSITTFTYNARGIFEDAQKEGELVSKRTILFNEGGNMVEASDELFGVLSYQSTCKYNDQNQKIEQLRIYFSGGSNLVYKDVYRYDKYGNLVEEKSLRSNNEISKVELYEYDKRNNLIQKKELGNTNNIKRKETFKYDQKNILIESYEYGEDEKLSRRREYRYDKNGNLTDHLWFNPDGELMGRISIEYDLSGNEIKWAQMQKDGSYLKKYKNRYNNDNKGNWIEKVSFSKDKPSSIEERAIEYY